MENVLSILHLDTGRELRGGQRQLLLLARGLDGRGHRQWIVCREGSALEGRARAEGLRTFALPAHDPGALHGLVDVRQELRSTRFDILHAHDGRGQTLSALASLGLPVRRVATRRVVFAPRGLGARLRLQRLQYGYTCDAIIAISQFIRDLLVQAGVPATKIEVIPDGIEIPAALPDAEVRSRQRRQWGFDPEAFLIGHVGAFTHEKGQELALEAFALLSSRLPQAGLLLVGDGPLRVSQGVSDRVRRAQGRARLLDPMEDLAPFFSALDLYVMPSRSEGLGSSALLAMAHGLPLVATRVGGLAEVVEEGRTGWLASPESPEALAEAIVAAASDRERLRRLSAAARERAGAFSSKITLDRTEALYRQLVAGKV